MRILFDTNVILDFLLARDPFAVDAALLVERVNQGKIEGFLCATTVTTVHYLATKTVGRRKAHKHLRELLHLFKVAPVDSRVLSDALDLGFSDYEDAVLHEAARAAKAVGIVTRDREGFAKAILTVFGPRELLAVLEVRE